MDSKPPRHFLTRFAPSPTGYLHIGHAAALLEVWKDADQNPDHFLLRIEDIDSTRCRPEFEASILEDLAWLGIKTSHPVRRQSDHFTEYKQILDLLEEKELIYPCFCTRKEIKLEIGNAPSAPHGETGYIYPGTCKHLHISERTEKILSGHPYALRLDLDHCLKNLERRSLKWYDTIKGWQFTTPELLIKTHGDVVLARKDTPASYHLCVTHDDSLQHVTHITRGKDLFHSTHIHRLLQEILGYDTPSYHHHPLMTDNTGRRFAKRDKSLALRDIRKKGISGAQLKNMILHSNIDELLI
ncbi:MAG: tRNA glutamyl-Q(34) synthetase GluQRS [Pseudobdellovibrionaceae bacterium]|jgi:glutamyl-Q tRNA(Asp) synthetase|nr:tRNA glutamyl-Q(34) synthetase GluQRS [Pseudobdellovibrionaceae bacterium]